MKTITLKIIGMHCTSCAINIDFELEDIEGVKEAKTHYAKQQTEITFDNEHVAVEEIIAIIGKLGYEAVLAPMTTTTSSNSRENSIK